MRLHSPDRGAREQNIFAAPSSSPLRPPATPTRRRRPSPWQSNRPPPASRRSRSRSTSSAKRAGRCTRLRSPSACSRPAAHVSRARGPSGLSPPCSRRLQARRPFKRVDKGTYTLAEPTSAPQRAGPHSDAASRAAGGQAVALAYLEPLRPFSGSRQRGSRSSQRSVEEMLSAPAILLSSSHS
jgi:hypothetical protein